jgi:hypothetical protein
MQGLNELLRERGDVLDVNVEHVEKDQEAEATRILVKFTLNGIGSI